MDKKEYRWEYFIQLMRAKSKEQNKSFSMLSHSATKERSRKSSYIKLLNE